MVFRYRKFDAKAYWANKPLCTLCKIHKVKNGAICYECKKLEKKNEAQILKNKQVKDNYMDKDEETKEVEIESSDDVFGVDVSGEAQNKIIRLFTYLEKALALDGEESKINYLIHDQQSL